MLTGIKQVCMYGLIACVAIFSPNPLLAQESDEEKLEFPTTQEEIIKLFDKKPEEIVGKPIGALRTKGNASSLFDQKARSLVEVPNDHEIDEAILENALKVGALVLFDYDSAEVEDDSKPLLEEFANAFQSDILKDAVFVIAGHTDSKGSEAYNVELSRQRADAVRHFLISRYQIAENRLFIKPYGELRPIATNKSSEGRAQNRRVEFIRVQ